MYSYEIDEMIKIKDWILKPKDYLRIYSSPQITHLHYDAYSNKYHIYTDDDYHWEFEVRKD